MYFFIFKQVVVVGSSNLEKDERKENKAAYAASTRKEWKVIQMKKKKFKDPQKLTGVSKEEEKKGVCVGGGLGLVVGRRVAGCAGVSGNKQLHLK
jgi:uncharacterized protein GlcG (DUF336 family)